jgi:hypothetical protein
VEPSIVQDAIVGGEGTPSPMLSVAGLTLKELKPRQRDKPTSPSYLPASRSLHNGPNILDEDQDMRDDDNDMEFQVASTGSVWFAFLLVQ